MYGGVLLLTAVYAILAVTVHRLAPLCLDEPCNSEGINNSISGFVTDYFICLCMSLFAIHILFVGSSPAHASSLKCWAVLAQVGFAIAYLFGGMVHQFWANSGAGDSVGQLGFYFGWMFAYSIQFMTALSQYFFVSKLIHPKENDNEEQRDRCQCSSLGFMKICLGANFLATLLIVVGCIASLVSPEIMTTSELIDSAPDMDETPTTIWIINLGEVFWFVTYSTFWIPTTVAMIRRVPTPQQHQQSTRVIAIALPIVQWTIGSMYINWTVLVSILIDEDVGKVYQDLHGPIVYHFGVLLASFLFYSFSLAHLRDERTSDKANITLAPKTDEADSV